MKDKKPKEPKLKVRPMRNQILVKVDKIEEKSAGGILIARKMNGFADQNAKETGVIVAVGPLAFVDHEEGEEHAKVGDRIIFERYAGKFADDEQEYRLMNADFILGVIED